MNCKKCGREIKNKNKNETLCSACSKGPQYFEGVLQLRNANNEIISFVINDVKKNTRKGIFISKIEEQKNGADFYISNQTYIKVLAYKIQRQFGGTIHKNAKHFSQDNQTSKYLFRLNLLLEFPIFQKNDVLKKDGKLYKVLSLSKRISVIELKTNKKTSLVIDDDYKILKPVKTSIVQVYPYVEVLEPETYQPVKVANPNKKFSIGENVKVVMNENGEAYLV